MGTKIGTISTKDPDNDDTITQTHIYRLVDDAGGRFTIVNGALKVGRSSLAVDIDETDLFNKCVCVGKTFKQAMFEFWWRFLFAELRKVDKSSHCNRSY